jgi:hypothetical protein
MNLGLTPDYAGPQLLVPNLVRAVGQAILMAPLPVLATAGIEQEMPALPQPCLTWYATWAARLASPR